MEFINDATKRSEERKKFREYESRIDGLKVRERKEAGERGRKRKRGKEEGERGWRKEKEKGGRERERERKGEKEKDDLLVSFPFFLFS